MNSSPMGIISGRLLPLSTREALVRVRRGIPVKWKNIGVLRCATIIKSQRGVVVPSIKCFYNALESRVKLWENLAPQCLGGQASGDEESCVMMARSKEDSLDEEDCNSFEGDDSNNGEFYDSGNNDAEMEIKRETARSMKKERKPLPH